MRSLPFHLYREHKIEQGEFLTDTTVIFTHGQQCKAQSQGHGSFSVDACGSICFDLGSLKTILHIGSP